MSWAWEQDLVEALPRFPKMKPQRDVAGRHYLTKPEINALYFATHQMRRPKGWNLPVGIGRYWRAALVMFFKLWSRYRDGMEDVTVSRADSVAARIVATSIT
jgi:hypothetical protein